MVAGLRIVHRLRLSSIVQRTWLFGPLKLGFIGNMQLTKNQTRERDTIVWVNRAKDVMPRRKSERLRVGGVT